MVAFSNQGETFQFSTKSLCYKTELAKATPSNIEELKIFVDSLQANGKWDFVSFLLLLIK